MVELVAYGSEDGKRWYVQTACDEEHDGSPCGCKSYGEDFDEESAKELANKLGRELEVPVERW